MNTLSDPGLHPDVLDVNICKYRLRQWSHVAQHSYIYHLFKPNTHTHKHMEGSPDVIDGSHLCLWFALQILFLTFAL